MPKVLTVQLLEVPRRHCERPTGAKQSQKCDCTACSEPVLGLLHPDFVGVRNDRRGIAVAPRNDKTLPNAELLPKIRHLFKTAIILFLFPAFGFCATQADINKSNALTLFDCYRLALKQSEIIAIDSELIKQAEARFLQALGTIMPQVSFLRSDRRQDVGTSTSPKRGFEQKFVFKQTLFSGFKEFAGMSGSKLEKGQRENELLRAKQLLFADVSGAFYLLIETREDLNTLDVIKKAFSERINELKTRVDLGKSRTSEVVSTEVQLYSLQDQIELVKSQELIVKELLEFLIGRPVDQISEPSLNYTLKSESEYLAKASLRPDVLAADFAWKADKKRLTIAKSGFLPQVSLEADYFNRQLSALNNSKWDALLKIDFPIFEGTTTYGLVKEAGAIARQSGLLFKRLGRLALQDIHDSYVNTQAGFLRVDVLKKALKSAELNYNLQAEDYKLNLVNNLNVLSAIQDLENIRRSLNHISNESKRFYWQLLVASGEINLDRQ